MKIVICRKHLQHNMDKVLDLHALTSAMRSGFGTVQRVFSPSEDHEVAPYIEQMTRNGFVCHLFKYEESFQNINVVTSLKANVA